MSVANDIVSTSATGGTGDLTLAAPASGPFLHAAQFTDYWGAGLPDPWVDYTALEWTDATDTSSKQVEIGYCPLHTGTTLRRSAGTIIETYVQGTGVTPSVPNPSAPSALTLGAMAANIRIVCAPHAGGMLQLPRFRNDANTGVTNKADNLGWASAHMASVGGTNMSVAANTLYYFPFLVARRAWYTKATIYVQSGASGNARFGLYRPDGTGWADNLIVDWGATAQFNVNATGLKTVTLASAVQLDSGWYVGAFTASSAPTLSCGHIRMPNFFGTASGATISTASKSLTYAALAASAAASSGFGFTSGNTIPCVLLQ